MKLPDLINFLRNEELVNSLRDQSDIFTPAATVRENNQIPICERRGFMPVSFNAIPYPIDEISFDGAEISFVSRTDKIYAPQNINEANESALERL